MRIDQSFLRDVLSPDEFYALSEGIDLLIDQSFDDVIGIGSPGWSVANSFMADHLPRRYLPAYTPLFAKQFLVCILTVAWKLAQPHPSMLSCVAEELALRAIIDRAILVSEERGAVADFSQLEEELYEDMDFEFLFDFSRDGVERSEVGARLGMGSLDHRDWFKPFGAGSRGAVHPYLDDGPSDRSEY